MSNDMESKKDLYEWFKYWTNGVSLNKSKPLNITVTQLDGKYPYKSKSKRLIKKWTKQHTLNAVKYKYCKVDMSKVSDFGSCNNEFTLNYNLTYIKNIGTKKMASKEAENYYQKVGLTYTGKERDNFHRGELMSAFDAGVEYEKKKHEWHSLAENPEDLPTHFNQILVAFAFNKVTNEFYSFDVASYFGNSKSFITNSSDSDNVNNGKKIIAWKEIE